MKKPFTFIISIVLCTGLFAQKENHSSQLKSTLSAGQKPDSTIVWIVDNVWTPQSKSVYSYDGNKKEILYYSWDAGLSSWDLQIKYLDTYNENGDMINQFSWSINPDNSEWDTLANLNYTYDDVLGLTSWVYEAWNQATHNWYDLLKGEYDYFEGREYTFLHCRWNTTMARWDSLDFSVIIMNVDGKDSSGTYYRWTTQDSPRYADCNYEIFYDENGRDTLYYEESQAEPGEKYKSVTIYNNNGLKMYTTSYSWVDNAWSKRFRTEYTYDENGNLVLKTSQEWNVAGQEWVSVRKEQNYYAIETALNNKFSKPDLLIYPNPASEYLMFKFNNGFSSPTFRLYNIDGIKVIDQKIYSNSVPVGHLPKGIYLYQLQDSGKVFRGKVVLK